MVRKAKFRKQARKKAHKANLEILRKKKETRKLKRLSYETVFG